MEYIAFSTVGTGSKANIFVKHQKKIDLLLTQIWTDLGVTPRMELKFNGNKLTGRGQYNFVADWMVLDA